MSAQRGPAPRDVELFAPERLDALRTATSELSWLLSRGYPEGAALKLVGDRHALAARQRKAVSRSACSEEARLSRRARAVEPRAVAGRPVHVDGLNVLITIESLLGGGVVLRGRDGAHRDLASVHGSWRRVRETGAAIEAMGAALAHASEVVVRLDRPVSNSGRLAAMMREVANAEGWPWRIELAQDPDAALLASGAIVASADARILDGARAWLDVPGALAARLSGAWIIDLGERSEPRTRGGRR